MLIEVDGKKIRLGKAQRKYLLYIYTRQMQCGKIKAYTRFGYNSPFTRAYAYQGDILHALIRKGLIRIYRALSGYYANGRPRFAKFIELTPLGEKVAKMIYTRGSIPLLECGRL